MTQSPASALRTQTRRARRLGARTLGTRTRDASTLRDTRPRAAGGLLAAGASVAAATGAIYPLAHVAPVVSLSVVYLPAILLVSTYWGAALGLFASLLSAAAFNFFHLPPTGRFTIADSGDWVALGAFVVVALVAAAIADLARSRAAEADRGRREADLAAALARELLAGADTDAALATAARRIAEALGLSSAAITAPGNEGAERRVAITLRDGDRDAVATLLVPRELPPELDERLRTRVVPALEALVAIARRRDGLQAERVQTEALRRSDDIKTALLRTVSHDLRSPLTAIVAAGHALAGSLDERDRAELSGAVVSEGARLAGLVDNLLDLSRLQAGAAVPRAQWVSIEDLVTAAAEGNGRSEDRMQVRLTIDPGVPEIRADAAQLERVFANLLENARRHGGAAPVAVHARRAGARVVVSVVDRGPGIDPVEQERIFEPFYRGPIAGPGSTGSGLGLAIVRGFVEANGGTIAVESLPGQGTSFIVSLPIESGPEPAGTAEAGAAAAPWTGS